MILPNTDYIVSIVYKYSKIRKEYIGIRRRVLIINQLIYMKKGLILDDGESDLVSDHPLS
jgi:hypothetical protein